jgi:hypothetical protein
MMGTTLPLRCLSACGTSLTLLIPLLLYGYKADITESQTRIRKKQKKQFSEQYLVEIHLLFI